MAASDDSRHDPDHVIVDFPQRLHDDEIERLNAAVARAPAIGTDSPQRHTQDEIDRARDYALALVDLRRARERQFDTVLFSDPAWDLLLTLFVRRVDGHPTSVGSACNGIGAPPSTALRHLSMLIEQGWVTRCAPERDPGVFYVEMADHALDRMVALLQPQDRDR